MMVAGHFVQENAVFSEIDGSGALVTHIISGESDFSTLVFDSGETLRVRLKILVRIERMEVKGEAGDDRIALDLRTSGTLHFLDEDEETLFASEWQNDAEQTQVILDGDSIAAFDTPLTYQGSGMGAYQGYSISGRMTCSLTRNDASGMDAFTIQGDGLIQPNSSGH